MASRRRQPPPGRRPNRHGAVGPLASLPLLLIGSIALIGCGEEAAYEKVEPYELTATDEGINRVTLTQRASDRLLLETAPVAAADVDGQDLLTVPYAALIYDTEGGTWVYLQTESLTYTRVAVEVDYIEADTVYLTDAPDLGAEVAVTSVAELYGADTGVGK